MPNYCNVSITFSVKKEEDRHLLTTLEQEFLTKGEVLNVLRPMPKEYEEGEKWYDWCCENWGTKWDIIEGYNIGLYSHDLHIYGDTAWSPPIAALLYYHQQHPEIIIDVLYFEPGNEFAGHTRFEDGKENELHYLEDFAGQDKEELQEENTEFSEYFLEQMEDRWDDWGMDSDNE